MRQVLEIRGLTRRFGALEALRDVNLEIGEGTLVGLVGKNGSGKTTLLRHAVGLQLPTVGSVTTLGAPSAELGHEELRRIGFVPQEILLLEWMTVRQHLRFVESFYPAWDRGRESRLLGELELDLDTRVGALSSGNLQKLALILAVCHHPGLILLDEPVSDLDPIARGHLLGFLVELVLEDGATVVVSSHVLRDIESVVDWIVCLDRGRVTTDASLDDLRETWAEWRVTSRDGRLPERFDEPFVLEQEVIGREAVLTVRRPGDLEAFRSRHAVEVTPRPLNLERMFPLMIAEPPR